MKISYSSRFTLFFDSGKMTLLDFFDMYSMFFDIFNQYFDRFGQYLVMYLVTGLKGLPGGRFDLSRGPGPPWVLLWNVEYSAFHNNTRGCPGPCDKPNLSSQASP